MKDMSYWELGVLADIGCLDGVLYFIAPMSARGNLLIYPELQII